MADKKDNKPTDDDSPFNSSGELFETLFREELDTLSNGQAEKKAAPKKEKKVSTPKRPKPLPKREKNGPRKADPQAAARLKRDVAQKRAARVHVDRPGKASTKPAPTTSTVVEKKPVSPDKGDAPEDVKPKKKEKFGKLRRGRIGSQPKLGGGSDKIKIAVLCVILVVAVAFIVNALGIVDFGGLLGISEPTKDNEIEPRVAKNPPAKTVPKTPPKPIKPPPKRTSNQTSKNPPMQKKTLIVKKSPQAAPAPTQPTSPAKNPVITQQRYRPATPVKRPPAVQQPPKPPLPDPRPVVVMKPSQPAPTTQKPVVNKEPYRPAQSQPSPVVAKKPLGVATTPKPPLVEKEPPKPSMPTQGETVSAKGELFAEERIRSYPYSVYLGSYQTRDRAEKAVFALQRKGLSPYWVEVHLGEKGVWYRVFNGYYKSQEEAEEFIKRKGLEDAKPKRTKYATLIGVYATESGAQQKFVSLSRLGYYPYLIDQANGESLLFIGAFLTKKGAERLHSELTSKGVRSRVVER